MNAKKNAAVVSGGVYSSETTTTTTAYPPAKLPAIAQAIVHYAGEGGLSIIPIDHMTKRPAMHLLPRGDDGKCTWAPFAQAIADDDTLIDWGRSDIQAIAVVCGAVSGGLLVIDFDVPAFYERWRSKVGALADGLPVQRTGGGGYQVFLRCPNSGGNLKLAWAIDDEEATGRTIAIETRGEGGYAVVPPSLHPSGGRYEMIEGDLSNIPLLTQEQADALLDAARKLDEAPRTRQQQERMEQQAVAEHGRRGAKRDQQTGIIGAYNEAHTVEEMLERHGYTRDGDRYIRPGGTSRSVSVHDGRSCHWSSNDPLNDGQVHDGMGIHDAFGIFCAMEHDGDVRVAVKAAAAELGCDGSQAVSIEVGEGEVVGTEGLRLEFDVKPSANKAAVTARRGEELVHADRFDLGSSRSRQQFIRGVIARLQLGDDDERRKAVETAIETALLQKLEDLQNAGAEPEEDGQPDPQALLDDMPDGAIDEAEQMLTDPHLIQRILEDIAALGVAGEQKLAFILYMLGVSRLLDKPLAAIVNGHTATGKSFLTHQVSLLFPPEAVVRATQLTPQALYHMPPGGLMHRWVVAGERSRAQHDEAAEATRALREMLSAGRLSKLMPVKTADGIETVLVEQEGPIAYTESTTLSQIFDEDRNRCLLLSTDEREEQTRRILRAQAASRSITQADREKIIQRHHAMQRILALRSPAIHIPYAGRLAELFPCGRPEARRAFDHTLSAISALALLHQRQRQTEGEQIIAAPIDYQTARRLLDGPMARALGSGISDGAARLLQRLRGWGRGREFPSSDVYQHEHFSERQVRGWLIELARANRLTVVQEGGRGRPYVYALPAAPAGGDAEPTIGVLPSVEEACRG